MSEISEVPLRWVEKYYDDFRLSLLNVLVDEKILAILHLEKNGELENFVHFCEEKEKKNA
jgi:hypothetical protein